MPRLPNRLTYRWILLFLLTYGGSASPGEKAGRIDAPDDRSQVNAFAQLETNRWKQPWLWSGRGGLIYTAEGKILATGHTEKGIGLWDVPTGKRIRAWEAPQSSFCWQIRLSADGRVMAAAGGKDQRVIQVCDVQTGKIRNAWTVPEYLLAIALSADGKLVASISNQGNIQVWDADDGKERGQFQGWAASFAMDGKTLLVASDKNVGIWDLATRKEKKRLEGTANSLALSSDGKVLAGSGDKGIHLWNVTTGERTRTITANMGGFHMSTVCISADGRTVALTNDKMIAAWDTETGRIRLQIPGNWWFMASALSADGGTLIFSDGSEVIRRQLAATPRP